MHRILIITLIIYVATCQESKYDYKITVPENPCSGDALSVQGKDVEKLKFTWRVTLKKQKICDSQRCRLMAWNLVRQFETYLVKESVSGKVDLNKTATPGIEYVLEVTVNDKNGALVEKKQFSAECKRSPPAAAVKSATSPPAPAAPPAPTTAPTKKADDTSPDSAESTTKNPDLPSAPDPDSEEIETMQSQVLQQPSLKLLGSNVTYPDLTYILNAQVVNCDLNCNYHFQWDVFDSSNRLLPLYNVKGSEFRISGVFQKDSRYLIKCSVVNASNNAVIDSGFQNVDVLERDLILELPVSNLVVGLNKPFKLVAYVKDPSNDGTDFTITWECSSKQSGPCSDFKASTTSLLDISGLSAVDSYVFTITLTKGNVVKKSSCEVQVINDAAVKLDIDVIESPVDPSKRIEIPVYVLNLVTGCTLLWTVVDQPASQPIDQETILGNLNKLFNVTLREDEFLSDIDEFSTSALNMDFNLNLPDPSETWAGLVQNFTYIFRLNVTCSYSEEVDDETNETIEPVYVTKFVPVYADISVKTGILPAFDSLDVVPKEGIAMKTQFSLIAVPAVGTDRPMLYKFGYFMNNQTIFIANLMDVANTSSVLPYLDDGVKTFLVGCNSYSLCAQVIGPVIVTTLEPFNKEEQTDILEASKQLINREEYYKAFTYYAAVLQTYRSLKDIEVIETTQDAMSNLTSTEIKRLLMLNADGNKDWSTPATDLLKSVGLLLTNLPSSTILLNNVVTIRDELARTRSMKLVEHKSEQIRTKRQIRRRSIEKVSLEEVEDFLSISELIITTSTSKSKIEEEKRHLLREIDRSMAGLCMTLYERSQIMNLELKTLILTVEKFNPSFSEKFYHILYPENSWKINGRLKMNNCSLKSTDTHLCLGKAAFKNYFNKKKLVHMAKIYSAQREDLIYPCSYMLVLPISSNKSKQAKCTVASKRFSESQCKTVQLTSKAIQCSCSKVGFYTLEYVSRSKTTTSPSTTTISFNDSTIRPNLLTFSTVEVTMQATDVEVLQLGATKPATASTAEVTTFDHVSADGANSTLAIDGYNHSDGNVEMFSTNETDTSHDNLTEGDETVLYFVIGFSLIGIIILLYGIKRLLKEEEQPQEQLFPKYAILTDEHLLHDVPIP